MKKQWILIKPCRRKICLFTCCHEKFAKPWFLVQMSKVVFVWLLIVSFLFQFLFVLCHATCQFIWELCSSKGFFCSCSTIKKRLVSRRIFLVSDTVKLIFFCNAYSVQMWHYIHACLLLMYHPSSWMISPDLYLWCQFLFSIALSSHLVCCDM